MKNQLFYGDCLDVLQNRIEDESIDLIYIDPPFNSKRNYNVLFESIDMTDAKAQKEAFADTWSNVKYLEQLEMIQDLNLDLWKFLNVLNKTSLRRAAVSYLTTMGLRIHYIHKALKPTGSFYLHCDPAMSHGLKMVCDFIFGLDAFRNEIIWHYRRWPAKSNRFQRMHDVILFYAKEENHFNTQFEPYGKWLEKDYKYIDDEGRRWRWHSPHGKREKVYLDDPERGVPMNDVWQIPFIGSTAKERMGFPTQKPEALLERIIQASTDEGDTVADFFCGCGTAVAVADRLKRRWIGVDISHLAVKLIHNRVLKPYRSNQERFRRAFEGIEINGFPRDIATARELAAGTKKGRLKFQDWIIEFMLEGVANPKKVGDGGYDGYITFRRAKGHKDVALVEVKSGAATISQLRSFIKVVHTEKCALGIWVCFADQVTAGMQREALEEGYYDHEAFKTKFPRIQILTVEDLLQGKGVQYPYPAEFNITFG